MGVGGGGVNFPENKCYGSVRFNVISVTMGWVGVKFPGKGVKNIINNIIFVVCYDLVQLSHTCTGMLSDVAILWN